MKTCGNFVIYKRCCLFPSGILAFKYFYSLRGGWTKVDGARLQSKYSCRLRYLNRVWKCIEKVFLFKDMKENRTFPHNSTCYSLSGSYRCLSIKSYHLEKLMRHLFSQTRAWMFPPSCSFLSPPLFFSCVEPVLYTALFVVAVVRVVVWIFVLVIFFIKRSTN